MSWQPFSARLLFVVVWNNAMVLYFYIPHPAEIHYGRYLFLYSWVLSIWPLLVMFKHHNFPSLFFSFFFFFSSLKPICSLKGRKRQNYFHCLWPLETVLHFMSFFSLYPLSQYNIILKMATSNWIVTYWHIKKLFKYKFKRGGNIDRFIDLGGIISGLRKGSVAVSLCFGL